MQVSANLLLQKISIEREKSFPMAHNVLPNEDRKQTLRQKPVVPQPNASDLYAALPVITSFEPGKIWTSASTPRIIKDKKCSSNEEVSRPIQITKIERTLEPILVTSKKLNSNKKVRWND